MIRICFSSRIPSELLKIHAVRQQFHERAKKVADSIAILRNYASIYVTVIILNSSNAHNHLLVVTERCKEKEPAL